MFVQLVLLTTAVARRPGRPPAGASATRTRFPFVLLAGALVLRLEWAQMGDWYNLRFRTHGIAWFFLLGWLIQRSTTTRRKRW